MPKHESNLNPRNDPVNEQEAGLHQPAEGAMQVARINQKQTPTEELPDGDNPCLHCREARRLIKEWKFEQAVVSAEASIRLTGGRCGSWLTLAAVWERVAQLNDGMVDRLPWRVLAAVLKKAVRHNPTLAVARQKLAFAYRELGYLRPALRHYRAAENLDPNDIHTMEGMALVLLWLGDPEHRQIFRKLLELDPDNLTARENCHNE